jgi:hypothetical protein
MVQVKIDISKLLEPSVVANEMGVSERVLLERRKKYPTSTRGNPKHVVVMTPALQNKMEILLGRDMIQITTSLAEQILVTTDIPELEYKERNGEIEHVVSPKTTSHFPLQEYGFESLTGFSFVELTKYRSFVRYMKES